MATSSLYDRVRVIVLGALVIPAMFAPLGAAGTDSGGLAKTAVTPSPGSLATLPARPGATMIYDITHGKYGYIGEHRILFRRDDGDLVVDVNDTIAVKMLMFTVFRFEARRRERWHNGRLIAYDSTTRDGGKEFTVRARAESGALVIDGADGRIRAPADTFPSHPWNPAILRQNQVMDAKTGALVHLTAEAVGREEIRVGERPVMASHYVVVGDQRRELWFGDDGTWLRLRFRKDGANITFTLR